MSGPPVCDNSWQARRGRYVGRRHVLHLIDEQGDPDAEVGRDRGGLGEQFREVDLEVTGIRPAALSGHVDAQRHGDRGPLGCLGVAQGEGLEDAEEILDPVRGAMPGRESRTAICIAAATGRLIDWSGLASILPVPHSRCRAIDLNVFSSTVLPTPRSPVSTMLRSGRPRAIRSSTTSNWPISRSRPVSSGGRAPRRGHTDCAPDPWHRTLWPDLAQTLDLLRKPYRRVAAGHSKRSWGLLMRARKAL